MRPEKVLVTGAAGLLGRYAVGELTGRYAVSGLDLQAAEPGMPFMRANICDGEAVALACKGQDAIVHIAAVPNPWAGSADQIMTVNVGGTWNVLRAAEEAGVHRVVLVSSTASLGLTFKSGVGNSEGSIRQFFRVRSHHPCARSDARAGPFLSGIRH